MSNNVSITSTIEEPKYYRVLVQFEDKEIFETMAQNFIMPNTRLQPLLNKVLLQCVILLTQKELIMLKLSFRTMNIHYNNDASQLPIIVLSNEDFE